MVAQIDRPYVRARPLKAATRLLSYGGFEGRPLTTRGRWINPLVLAFLRGLSRVPRLRKVDRPVFILGTGRSGTTVLGVLLSMHRQVGFLNEPKALWHVIHGGEDLIGNYTREPARYRLDAGDVTDAIQRRAGRLYGNYLALTGARRVLDKYPELVFRLPFVLRLFPDARFLFLVRNGWSTCTSVGRWSERLGTFEAGETHDWWGVERRKWRLLIEQVAADDPSFAAHTGELLGLEDHNSMAAVEWILTMREGQRVRAAWPDQVLTVRYEDLATVDPAPALARLLEFLELDDDPVFTRYALDTLSPAGPATPVDLHPLVRPPFDRQMASLGYPA